MPDDASSARHCAHSPDTPQLPRHPSPAGASIDKTSQKSAPSVDTLFRSKVRNADSEFRAVKDQAVSAFANWLFISYLFSMTTKIERWLQH
jgi:hypothetical protein